MEKTTLGLNRSFSASVNTPATNPA